MRKKAHIFLAGYITDNMDWYKLNKHRKAFLLGSILPDCKPSFITQRHEFGNLFQRLEKDIDKLSKTNDSDEVNMRAYCRNLGQVTHYVADFFTLPHNTEFQGNIKNHCQYEKKLNHSLKEYIESGEAEKNREKIAGLLTPEAICSFIKKMHDQYRNGKLTLEEDCRYIVSLSCQVVDAIVRLFLMKAEPTYVQIA